MTDTLPLDVLFKDDQEMVEVMTRRPNTLLRGMNLFTNWKAPEPLFRATYDEAFPSRIYWDDEGRFYFRPTFGSSKWTGRQ